MKKYLISTLTLLSVFSCIQKESSEIINPTKIGHLIDSITSINKDFDNNEVTIEKFNSNFKKIIFNKLKNENNFIEDLDFKLEGVNKFNEGYLINLSKFSTYYVNDTLFYSGNLNAICLTNDENIISKLKEDSLYKFKAQFKGELKEFPYLVNSIKGNLYTPLIGYNNYSYDLGVLIFTLDTIYESKNRID